MAAYDKKTDYQALINEALARGDYKAAGGYEQQRNAKIAGEGITAYKPTQNFGSAFDQQMFTNEELGKAYDLRQAAAAGTADKQGVHNYVEDIRSKYGYSGGASGSGYEAPTKFTYDSAPEYVSRYQGMIDDLSKQILQREAFDYDPSTDPAYQQYAEQYQRGGQRAMQDTLAQVSARNGGLTSSYAQGAAQQTYQNYMAALADKIPELRQLAYDMYLSEGNQMKDNLSIVNNLENTDWQRYLAGRDQFNTDRSFGYGQFRDTIGDTRYADELQYSRGRDAIADQRYEDETAYERSTYEDETAYNRQQDAYTRLAAAITGWGYQPTAEELEAAGMSQEEANAAYNTYFMGMYGGSSGGGGGGSRGSGGGRSGGSGSGSGTGSAEQSLYEAMMMSGNPELYLSQNYKKYGVAYSQLSNILSAYNTWRQTHTPYDSNPILSNWMKGGGGLSGGNSSGGSSGGTSHGDAEMTNTNSGSDWISVPGYGRVTPKELQILVSHGNVEARRNSDGTVTYRKAGY